MNTDPLPLSVIVPVYNEADSICPFLHKVEPVMQKLGVSYEVIFALDPSSDNTDAVIRQEIKRNPAVKLMVFSRRFGQPAATMAGILQAKGDRCVVIDVDLQDPPELIFDMYKKMDEGFDVVYATRRSRKGETLLKRLISALAYKIIQSISEFDIPRNTGDFRIMSRRVIERLRSLKESHGYLRGLVAFVGYKQVAIEYDREARLTGAGHYNRFTGSLKIGMNGLVCFSKKPLQLVGVLGSIFVAVSFIFLMYFLLKSLFLSAAPTTLSIIVVIVMLFSGIQLLSLALVSAYVGRIYDEVKFRPQYIVDKVYESEQ